MSFGLGFSLPNWQTLSGGFSPLSLFQGGVQGAFFDPSDATTLFTTSAGTTPCAEPGAGALVNVGAMLDARAPGYSVYFDGTGDYLSMAANAAFEFGSGDFTIECWIYPIAFNVNSGSFMSNGNISGSASWAVSGTSTGAVFFTAWSGGTTILVNFSTSNGALAFNTWSHVAVTRNGNLYTIWINGVSSATSTVSGTIGNTGRPAYISYGFGGGAAAYQNIYASNVRWVKGTAVYTGNFTPSGPLTAISGTSLLTCGITWSGNPAITKNGDARIDGLNPFQASPVGNHAIAANDTTARPELSARVNLLTYTEQFDNGVWSKTNTTISVTKVTDPFGGTTAQQLFETTTNAGHLVSQSGYAVVANLQYTSSVYVKANGRTKGQVLFYDSAGSGSGAGVTFDLTAETVADYFPFGTGTVVAKSISAVGSGWYRISVTSTATTSTLSSGIWFIRCLDAAGNISYAGDVTKGLIIWGADLRPANIGALVPAYQRIADQYTYDTVGFPRYLRFDGVDDAMSTPANIPFATVTSDGLARRNLLLNPTQFDASYWTKVSTTVVADAGAAPDATTTADRVYPSSTGSSRFVWVAGGVSVAASAHTLSFYAKAAGKTWVYVNAFDAVTTVAVTAFFDLQNGVVGSLGTYFNSSSITAIGNGWYRCTVTRNVSPTTTYPIIGISDSDATLTATANGTDGVLLWGAQLETGSTATAFQNIGTDKATVFAGVRKFNNTTQQFIVETSNNSFSSNGAFSLLTNTNNAGGTVAGAYGGIFRGTSNAGYGATGTTAPISNVVTALGNIAAATDASILRVNGVQVATSGATSAGTGNFGSYPMYIASRQGVAPNLLEGHIYSLIVVGSAVSAGQISATEQWVAGKTGITI